MVRSHSSLMRAYDEVQELIVLNVKFQELVSMIFERSELGSLFMRLESVTCGK